GESLAKRGAVIEDRISDLPEHLILQILSLLPTKLVIATSVLSKQWRSVWKMVPILQFESKRNIRKFSEDVCKSLLSHKAPVLESLHLNVNENCEDVYIGIWAAIAITRHVRELLLHLRFSYSDSRVACFVLKTLKLKDCVLIDIPSKVPVGFW
ncbi:unnamed protein product, partial [Thlaspi arvense]